MGVLYMEVKWVGVFHNNSKDVRVHKSDRGQLREVPYQEQLLYMQKVIYEGVMWLKLTLWLSWNYILEILDFSKK